MTPDDHEQGDKLEPRIYAGAPPPPFPPPNWLAEQREARQRERDAR